jgi:hypothetical protein
VGAILGGLALAVVLAFLFGLFVMWLWNWLMPAIFGLGTITYWQAWGLVLLAHLLFKVGGHHHDHNHRRDERWKERFRERFSKRETVAEPPESSDDETAAQQA